MKGCVRENTGVCEEIGGGAAGSRPRSEVRKREELARLGWGTALEVLVGIAEKIFAAPVFRVSGLRIIFFLKSF